MLWVVRLEVLDTSANVPDGIQDVEAKVDGATVEDEDTVVLG